ncbi:MAG: hypothetical protein Q3966_04360 [Neisseria sp.]|nr:hypothetical protein [Neisseria sp.]
MTPSVQDYIAAWRGRIQYVEKPWVLFEHGTCVILMQPAEDLAAQAQELMREWGGVAVGTPSADFGVTELANNAGWVVTGHHNNILNFVFPDEGRDKEEFAIGLIGRSYRAADADGLKIVHIEDHRGA